MINLKALSQENLAETMRRDFNNGVQIQKRNCISIYLGYLCSQKSQRYHKLLKRSQSRFNKEMDLQKFLYR